MVLAANHISGKHSSVAGTIDAPFSPLLDGMRTVASFCVYTLSLNERVRKAVYQGKSGLWKRLDRALDQTTDCYIPLRRSVRGFFREALAIRLILHPTLLVRHLRRQYHRRQQPPA